MVLALLYIGAALLGSVPVGFLICKAKGIDIRKVGSGNIGATNVKRALGTKWGIGVFLLDAMKGMIPAVVAGIVLKGMNTGAIDNSAHQLLVGLSAVLGHMFSPFLGFKGGKGVATGVGAMIGTMPAVGLSCFAVFFVFMFLFKMVSLASVAGTATLPIWAKVYIPEETQLFWLGSAFAALIIVKHHANIKRIIKGEEPKFSLKSDDSANQKQASNGLDTQEGAAEEAEPNAPS
jgi:glycerol-3-phosphate acyltransferase PlsY